MHEGLKIAIAAVVAFSSGGLSGFLVHPMEADFKLRMDRCDSLAQKALELANHVDLKDRDALKQELDNLVYTVGSPQRLPILSSKYASFSASYQLFNKSLREGTTVCTHTCLREAGAEIREACTDEFASSRWLWRRIAG